MSIKKSKNIYIIACKINNLYETDINSYNKLLTDNISKTYQKTNNKVSYSINRETKVIVEEFEVGDRVDCLGKTNTFIPLKDTTENFKLNPKCRLIISQRAKLVKLVNY